MALQADTGVKGTAVISILAWTKREYGEDCLSGILADMPSDLREAYRTALPVTWVPIAAHDAFMRGLARRAWPNDQKKTVSEMRRLGEHVAADNLSTVYKLVLAFTRPDGLITLMPRIWSTYFKGVEVVDIERAEGSAKFRVRNVGYYMLGAHAEGWLELAYRRVGSASASVRCVELHAGVPDAKDLNFTLEWTV